MFLVPVWCEAKLYEWENFLVCREKSNENALLKNETMKSSTNY